MADLQDGFFRTVTRESPYEARCSKNAARLREYHAHIPQTLNRCIPKERPKHPQPEGTRHRSKVIRQARARRREHRLDRRLKERDDYFKSKENGA